MDGAPGSGRAVLRDGITERGLCSAQESLLRRVSVPYYLFMPPPLSHVPRLASSGHLLPPPPSFPAAFSFPFLPPLPLRRCVHPPPHLFPAAASPHRLSPPVAPVRSGPVRWVWIHSQRLTFPPPLTPPCPPPPVASVPVLVSCGIFSKFPVNSEAPAPLRGRAVCAGVRSCGRGVSHM